MRPSGSRPHPLASRPAFFPLASTLAVGLAVGLAAVVVATIPALASGCVPSGSAPPYDAGSATATPTSAFKPSANVMTAPFEDTFDRVDASDGMWPAFSDAGGAAAGEAGAAVDAGLNLAVALGLGRDAGREAPSMPSPGASWLGPNWAQVKTAAWKIENGKLCGQGAHNHGVWLQKVLPVNARIEFDAVTSSDDGDLKTEVWGDGKSAATGLSYTNATSYLAIFGGWKNTIHALARLDEHGKDRREIPVDKSSDDPRQRPVVKGQTYRFKVERSDGRTVRWFIDNTEMISWADPQPLAGEGHDHFGFNEWEVKVCFDNVKVTPL